MPAPTTTPTDNVLDRQLAHEGLLMRLAAQLAADPALTGPVDATEFAAYVAAQFRACLPLLARTGTLAPLGLSFVREVREAREVPVAAPAEEEEEAFEIDPSAAADVLSLGGDFLGGWPPDFDEEEGPVATPVAAPVAAPVATPVAAPSWGLDEEGYLKLDPSAADDVIVFGGELI